MNLIRHFIERSFPRNLTKVKLVLLISFTVLLFFQFMMGFQELEDYLLLFIFVLFLNDLHFKINRPECIQFQEDRHTRRFMSFVFLALFSLPFILDSFNVSNGARLMFYKLGFVLWAQVFLIDAFSHYKATHSKKWLVFANTAALMILVGAFAS